MSAVSSFSTLKQMPTVSLSLSERCTRRSQGRFHLTHSSMNWLIML